MARVEALNLHGRVGAGSPGILHHTPHQAPRTQTGTGSMSAYQHGGGTEHGIIA